MKITQDSKSHSATQYADTPSQYLTFRLADETYAVGILQVREILRYEELTKVPSTPDSIRGVLNLRGSVVPVVDLTVKFGLPSSAVTKWTCIVIVETVLDGEHTVMGILADSVSEVLDLREDAIEPPPPFGTKVHVEYLIGMGKAKRRFILILDIDKVLSAEDVTLVTDGLDTIEASEPESPACEVDKTPEPEKNTKSKPRMEDKKREDRTTKPYMKVTSKNTDTKPKEATLSNRLVGIPQEGTEKRQDSKSSPVEKDGKASLEDEKAGKTSADPAKDSEKVETKEAKGDIIQKESKNEKSKSAGIEKKKDTDSEKAEAKAEKDENKKQKEELT